AKESDVPIQGHCRPAIGAIPFCHLLGPKIFSGCDQALAGTMGRSLSFFVRSWAKKKAYGKSIGLWYWFSVGRLPPWVLFRGKGRVGIHLHLGDGPDEPEVVIGHCGDSERPGIGRAQFIGFRSDRTIDQLCRYPVDGEQIIPLEPLDIGPSSAF